MANLKNIKSNALSTIDAAVAILDKYPNLYPTSTQMSANLSANPFTFLMDCFKGTVGYDVIIDILSVFIAQGLPPLEIATKSVLLTNIKNLLTCSLNPFITDEILRDGIIFDLSQIDITDKLRYSPLSKKGKYFYFGCDKCETAMDVRDTCTKKSNLFKTTLGGFIPDLTWGNNGKENITNNIKDSDFDCLLWYMKNRAARREVWSKSPKEPQKDEFTKTKKKDGILTLEFCENSRNIRNAEGDTIYQQTPYYNVLHVFIGDAQEITGQEYREKEEGLSKIEKEITALNEQIKVIDKRVEKIKAAQKKVNKNLKKNKITKDDYKIQIDNINDQMSSAENERQELTKQLQDKTLLKSSYIQTLNGMKTGFKYRKIDKNYYYHKTLIEFNIDYIMSLRLFDSKVVAAQLIDSLTGLASFDFNLSYKQILIRNEIKRMVSAIIESDDVVVNDCFFSFSNDEYNKLLEKSNLNKMGLFSINGETNSAVNIDSESLLNQLNTITDSSTPEHINSVIKGAMTEISKQLSTTDYLDTDKVNYGVQMNFIENLLNNLASVIAGSIFTPKVYLLILINLKLLGQDVNFNLEGFIEKFNQLIVNLIRTIRDQLIQYLVNKLMDILADISKEVAIKINLEQAQYYAKLIKRLIDCLKHDGSNLDFNVDTIDYADIYNQEVENNKKC